MHFASQKSSIVCAGCLVLTHQHSRSLCPLQQLRQAGIMLASLQPPGLGRPQLRWSRAHLRPLLSLPRGRVSDRPGQGPAEPGEASPLRQPEGIRQQTSFPLVPSFLFPLSSFPFGRAIGGAIQLPRSSSFPVHRFLCSVSEIGSGLRSRSITPLEFSLQPSTRSESRPLCAGPHEGSAIQIIHLAGRSQCPCCNVNRPGTD